MKKLFFKLLFLITGALAVMLVFYWGYRQVYDQDFDWPQNFFLAPEISNKYSLVKLGNSHSYDGIDLSHYKVTSLNLAGVAQRFETDLAVLKHHQKQIAPGAVIVISVSPISFSHAMATSESGFQSIYYGRVSPFLIPNINWGDYIDSEFFSFSRSGHAWRKRHSEVVRDRVSAEEKAAFDLVHGVQEIQKKEEILPFETPSILTDTSAANSGVITASSESAILTIAPEELPYYVPSIQQELDTFGQTKVGEDSVNFMYNKWYHTDEFSPEYFEKNKSDLLELVAYCLENGWRPVFVTVPIAYDLQDALADDYMQVYLYDHLINTNFDGIPYLNYMTEERITKNGALFSNSDHLNKKGAVILSYLLLQDLIKLQLLTPEVDGYIYPLAPPAQE